MFSSRVFDPLLFNLSIVHFNNYIHQQCSWRHPFLFHEISLMIYDLDPDLFFTQNSGYYLLELALGITQPKNGYLHR